MQCFTSLPWSPVQVHGPWNDGQKTGVFIHIAKLLGGTRHLRCECCERFPFPFYGYLKSCVFFLNGGLGLGFFPLWCFHTRHNLNLNCHLPGKNCILALLVGRLIKKGDIWRSSAPAPPLQHYLWKGFYSILKSGYVMAGLPTLQVNFFTPGLPVTEGLATFTFY